MRSIKLNFKLFLKSHFTQFHLSISLGGSGNLQALAGFDFTTAERKLQ
jgi:hypothetical protein